MKKSRYSLLALVAIISVVSIILFNIPDDAATEEYTYPTGNIKIMDISGTPLYILDETGENEYYHDRSFSITCRPEKFPSHSVTFNPAGLFVNKEHSFYYYSDVNNDNMFTVRGTVEEGNTNDLYWSFVKDTRMKTFIASDMFLIQTYDEEYVVDTTYVDVLMSAEDADIYFSVAQEFLDKEVFTSYQAEMYYLKSFFKDMLDHSSLICTSPQREITDADHDFPGNITFESYIGREARSSANSIISTFGNLRLDPGRTDSITPTGVNKLDLKINYLGDIYLLEWVNIGDKYGSLFIHGDFNEKVKNGTRPHVSEKRRINARFDPRNGDFSKEIYEYSMKLVAEVLEDYPEYMNVAEINDVVERKQLLSEAEQKAEGIKELLRTTKN